jgi:UDP-glucose 6-dehydrogenase
MQVVAFAKCNHKVICADCMLRMVMLYKTMQCPLCNGDLDQVSADGTPDLCMFHVNFCPAVA